MTDIRSVPQVAAEAGGPTVAAMVPTTPAAESTASLAGTAPSTPSGRLLSLDALRGFDMLWLIGGARFISSLPDAIPQPWARELALQMEHVEWEGFRFIDLIFPLFLFMIGVAIPLSLTKRLQQGASLASIYGHAIWRVAVMVLLGMTINGNLLTYDPAKFQLTYSVLQMLALGYFGALVLVLHLSLRWQVLATAGLLVGYWALQTFVPLPADTYRMWVYAEHANFGDWLNDQLLGSWQGPWRFGWILEISTHTASAMLGVFAARVLTSSLSPWRRVGLLVLLGLGCLAVGWAWGLQFPIIKNRWTSTFVLWAGGISYLLLAGFYAVIDVLGYRKWCWPLAAIGANSILAYLIACHFQPAFEHVVWVLFGGLAPQMGVWHGPWIAATRCLLIWAFLCHLYSRRILLRI